MLVHISYLTNTLRKFKVLYLFIEPVIDHCILHSVQSETAIVRKTLTLMHFYATITATEGRICQGPGQSI